MAVIEFPQAAGCESHAGDRRVPASIVGRIGAFLEWLRQRHRRRVNRERLRELCSQDDWIYRDLGISRADVEWASRLPLSVDAGCELERIRDRALMGR